MLGPVLTGQEELHFMLRKCMLCLLPEASQQAQQTIRLSEVNIINTHINHVKEKTNNLFPFSQTESKLHFSSDL